MRSLTIPRRQAVAKTPRRRRRFNPWKAAAVAAMAAPWMLLAGLFGGVAWVIWAEGGPDSFAARAKSEALLASLRLGFEIEEVWVDGLVRADRPSVLTAVGAVRGDPILEFDPALAREKLLRNPWIKDAVVARVLPNQINVTLTERVPLALWQRHGALAVIDRDGKVVEGAPPRAFGHLPIVVGAGADREAYDLIELVRTEPAVAERLTAAVFIAGRRWNIRLDDRIDVRLPADAPRAALARLAALEREHGLFRKDIIAIDLRLQDRLVVRLAPGAEIAGAVADGRPS